VREHPKLFSYPNPFSHLRAISLVPLPIPLIANLFSIILVSEINLTCSFSYFHMLVSISSTSLSNLIGELVGRLVRRFEDLKFLLASWGREGVCAVNLNFEIQEFRYFIDYSRYSTSFIYSSS
jgi:hypothetical protein